MNDIESGGHSREDREFVAPETGEDTELESEPSPADIDNETQGFSLSEEMAVYRNLIVEGIRADREDTAHFMKEWKRMGDENAKDLQGIEYDRAMVDMIMVQADVWKEIGDMDNYYDDLEDARMYADNTPGLELMVKHIDKLLG